MIKIWSHLEFFIPQGRYNKQIQMKLARKRTSWI